VVLQSEKGRRKAKATVATLKPFEMMYRICEPGLPLIYRQTRKMLTKVAEGKLEPPEILDIGGRKSHYTIGVPANITITDLPRRSATQHHLHLGFNQEVIAAVRKRRSNVRHVVIDDMTCSSLGTASFDCAVAVEVLEHVYDDAAFIREVRRVLRSNGVFIMTTPNGDYVRNSNPDHKRHYRRCELETLLRREFTSVDVRWAIPGTRFYWMALRSWSWRRPIATAKAFFGGIVNLMEDRYAQPSEDGQGMQELIAVAR
jgi:SAM-dependent methyltransferase